MLYGLLREYFNKITLTNPLPKNQPRLAGYIQFFSVSLKTAQKIPKKTNLHPWPAGILLL